MWIPFAKVSKQIQHSSSKSFSSVCSINSKDACSVVALEGLEVFEMELDEVIKDAAVF